MRVQDSIAMISGGLSGLGEETARQIVRGGGKVAILDVAEGKERPLLDELGSNAIFVRADVVNEDDVQAAVDKTVERFGRVNTVVNCAGIGSQDKVIGRNGPHSLAAFMKVLNVNLVGTFNLIRLAAMAMQTNTPGRSGERGVIINTASIAAFEGQVGQTSYSASKGAVASMTLPVARELAPLGIRVMTIAPGLFDTPLAATLPEKIRQALGAMVPFPSRWGEPAEYADLVRAIMENQMLNGTTIRLDGAIRMQAR